MKINKAEIKPYLMLFGGVTLATLVSIGGLIGIGSIADKNNGPDEFRTFSSCTSMAGYINDNYEEYYPYYYDDFAVEDIALSAPNSEAQGDGRGSGESKSVEYSTTNIQVDGVDESDVLKSDGEYAYYISTDEVKIIDITEPSNPTETGSIEFEETPQQMFLQGDTLVVQSQEYNYYRSSINSGSEDLNATHIYLYDVSDPAEPKLMKDVALQGSYYNARKIDNFVYIINTASFYNDGEFTATVAEDSIPKIAVTEDDQTATDIAADCSDISYFGDSASTFVAVTAIDIDSSDVTSKVMLGNTQNIYMSQENLYLATTTYIEDEEEVTDWEDLFGSKEILPAENPETFTEVIKLSVDGTDLKFIAANKVPGTVKNQFAMDEYYGSLRITTTLNDWFGWDDESTNNLYILDEDMELTGSVEGLAEGEQIYATRFFGDKAYVVTFRQVDPLFVIDLSDESNPEVLGELKVPGFSEYLHIYDENHVIGIGKDADEYTGRAEGVKATIFDVTDPINPTVLSEVILGGSGSYSAVLNDHKAFLFDKEKELMVIPVDLYESQDIDRLISSFYYEADFSGFVVFNINIEDGIVERGRVDYTYNDSYYYSSPQPRSMYVGENLLTFSDHRVKSSDLETLEELKSLDLR